MFCCGAEIIPKRSQCEKKPYPSYSLQCSLLICKDHLPKRGSVAISAPIKVFRLDSNRFKNLSDTERWLSTTERSITVPEQKLLRKQRSWCEQKSYRYTFCDAPSHYPVQCEHSLTVRWERLPNNSL